ncbi:hypothetical protein SSTG_05682 [Streptomyces sp. e14]|nr:hypothetical protein SSTG_05682 [Streptomyces sp. e14]
MSLPWAARGLKIPYAHRNDRQSRGLAMTTALGRCEKLARRATCLPHSRARCHPPNRPVRRTHLVPDARRRREGEAQWAVTVPG